MPVKKLPRLILLCCTFLPIIVSNAQQFERHQVVVAYVYNFAKNIKWQNEAGLKEFQFLVITEDEQFREEFNKLAATKTIRGKAIKIHFSTKPDNLPNAQLIFAGKEFENSLVDLSGEIDGKNTLLVTDGYSDRRFVMINITEAGPSKLHFEINKANILNQQLIVVPEMILLGGSEIDVASLYKESRQSLLSMQKQIDNLSSSSKDLQEKIRANELEVDKQNKLSAQQEELIQSQLKELSAQENRLKALQTEVITNSTILREKTQELADKENWLKEQETQVEKANQVLRSLNFSIDSLNRQVQEKEKVLNLQGYTIASQSKILYGLVVVIVLGLIAVFLLLRWYRAKTMLNLLLTAKTNELELANASVLATNEELIQSQEEIAAQRDVVSHQNKELEQSKLIIEKQNLEIKERNLNLEVEVESRTKELIEYNQQLEQFAFISAHNLRAPVARILGLGHLLELGENKNDPEILEKLVLTTKELDRVVSDLNIILEIRKNNTTIISEINLDAEVELIKISLAKEIAETEATIITEFGSVKSIRTIRPYMDSILVNLVSNAIKYRHAKRSPKITIKAEVQDSCICFTVKDNGLGIDLNLYKEKIFKLYSRFHDHVEGKGFGLYLVKTQVAAMGGRLEVESEVNEGTTFYIYLKIQ